MINPQHNIDIKSNDVKIRAPPYELKESKVKIQLKVQVSGSALKTVKQEATDTNETNTALTNAATSSTTSEITKLTIPVVATTDNGNQKLTKNVTIDLTKSSPQEFDLGEITGNGSKTIVIKGSISGKDVVMGTETINIDEFDGGRKVFDYTLNSL